MVRQNRERLAGTVEADETHIGGPVKGKTGRGVAKAKTKTLIAGAVEIVTYTQGDHFREKAGRLRLAILQDAGENEIKAFLNSHVAEGSKIKSDGWKGYRVIRTLERWTKERLLRNDRISSFFPVGFEADPRFCGICFDNWGTVHPTMNRLTNVAGSTRLSGVKEPTPHIKM